MVFVIDDIIGLALCAFFLRSMKNRGYDLYKGLDAFNKGDTKPQQLFCAGCYFLGLPVPSSHLSQGLADN
jgi:hypothetical protein